MSTIKHQCPHCAVQDIALQVSIYTSVKTNGHQAVLHLTCPRCDMPSAALIHSRHGQMAGNLGQVLGDPTHDQGWEIIDFWPKPSEPNLPGNLPADIQRIYLQAEHNFPVFGNEEAAGTMYRKALDVGLKKIDPTLSGTLGFKINTLTKNNRLTPDILEWSTHVRDLGNEAAHEEDPPSREELSNLRDFTDMVLQYLFTLPEMVRKRKEKYSENT